MIRDFNIKIMKPQIGTDRHRCFRQYFGNYFNKIRFLSAFICVYLWLIFLLSCSSPPSDLRTFLPAETLIYFETNDLGKTLDSLTESKAFSDAAKTKPDFSALKNMQVAIAVTGFESSETQVTDEQKVGKIKPHFIAVADTHSWNSATLPFAENTLGEFVNETYGGEVSLETSDKNGGKYFVWTATDGRKVFAFVEKSLVFFSNDESGLEKVFAVKKGEADSFAKSGKSFEKAENILANGYVSGEGIAQIANIAGISTAIDATDSEEGRSFIAGVLPQILQKTVKEVYWTATKTEQGIEDKYQILLDADSAKVFKETMISAAPKEGNPPVFIPNEFYSVTRYNLQNPQIAWRSLLLVTANQTDKLSGSILNEFSKDLLGNYGVSDAEIFLSAVDSPIFTVQFDAEGENSVLIADVKNAEEVKKSFSEIDFKKASEKQENAEIWKDSDGEILVAFVENKIVAGDKESVLKSLQAKQNGQNFSQNPLSAKLNESKSQTGTFGKDSGEKIVEVLGEKKAENLQMTTNFFTETRFTEKGIERKTVSPFGLVGTILEQFAKEQ